MGNCPSTLWNGGVNWCINANAPCIGCTNPDFPDSRPLYQAVDEADDD
jgi:hydrogenase small subunit